MRFTQFFLHSQYKKLTKSFIYLIAIYIFTIFLFILYYFWDNEITIIALALFILVILPIAFLWISFAIAFNKYMVSKRKLMYLIIAYILVIITFTFIYYFMSVGFTNYFEKDLDCFESLYFSVLTITTLGDVNITPIHFFPKICIMIELILGQIITVFGIASLFSNQGNDEKIIKCLTDILNDEKEPSIEKFYTVKIRKIK